MSNEPNGLYLRILLRQQGTGFYLQASGAWTTVRQSARNFADCVMAISFAKQSRLRGADVLMAGPDQTYDVVLARV